MNSSKPIVIIVNTIYDILSCPRDSKLQPKMSSEAGENTSFPPDPHKSLASSLLLCFCAKRVLTQQAARL